MKEPKDGGPSLNNGMSLRDYFAAAALQGLITHGKIPEAKSVVAEVAYEYADAMLTLRNRLLNDS